MAGPIRLYRMRRYKAELTQTNHIPSYMSICVIQEPTEHRPSVTVTCRTWADRKETIDNHGRCGSGVAAMKSKKTDPLYVPIRVKANAIQELTEYRQSSTVMSQVSQGHNKQSAIANGIVNARTPSDLQDNGKDWTRPSAACFSRNKRTWDTADSRKFP